MKEMKRILSLVLCFVMLVGMMPAIALSADAAGEVVDAALFFSDLHTTASSYKEQEIEAVMEGVKTSGLDFSTVTSVGDAFSSNTTVNEGRTTAAITEAIRTGLGDAEVPVYYTWSDHDRDTDVENFTGLMHSGENYYIYAISMSDMSSAERYGQASTFSEDKLTAFTNTVAGLDHTKPLFIASHVPLHDRRDDNQYANEWYEVISAAAEQMDVVFLWGHNHTEEASADVEAYYVAKDGSEELTIEDVGSVVPNFTYLNAGYLSPASTGIWTGSDVRQDLVVAAAIYGDSITFTTYDANGVCTGSDAMNETVAREFAAKTGPVVDDATGITVAATGITGVSVDVLDVAIPEGYAAYASYDIVLDGYEQGTEATVCVPVPDSFDVELPVLVLHEGEIIDTTAIVDGKVTFTANHFSAYTLAQTAAEEVLDWVQVSEAQNKTIFRLTDALTSGKNYVIVNRNTAGSGNAVNLNGTSINSVGVTVIADASGNYIEAPAATAQWTYSSNRFVNVNTTNRYLRGNSSGNMRTTTNSSDSYTTWSSNANGLYTTRNNTNYYINSSFTMTTSGSSSNRVYIYAEDTLKTEEIWAAMSGTKAFAFAVDSSMDNIESSIREAITVYTAADDTGADKAETTGYTLDTSKINPAEGGTYAVAVKYNGVEIGTIQVSIAALPYVKITVGGEDAAEIARVNVKVGDKIQLGAVAFNGTAVEENPALVWSVAEENASLATVNQNGLVTILDNNCSFIVYVSYTVDGEVKTDSIEIGVSPDNYLTPNVSTNDFPEYPHEGAIRFDKTAEAVGSFSETGVAKLELSMTGVPIKKGTDVIIMLDTSSSMTKNTVTGTSKTRAQVLEEALAKLLTQLKTKDAEGNYMDINVAIADFNGYYGDGSSGTSGTPYDRTSGDYVKNGTSNGSGYPQPSEARVYTGSKALNANAFIPVGELAASYTLNYTSGTNYDYAFDAIYQLGTAIKAENAEERELIVIFMSDGASLQWNYFGTQNGYTKWNNWLAGTWTASDLTTSNLNSTNHSYFYDLNDHDGDGHINEHRMANAIKGDPNSRYEIIRKSTAGLPEGTLVSANKQYLYTVPGLGATMYTINFDAKQDGQITVDSIDKALASTASDKTGSTQYYYKITTADELDSAFKSIGHDITYAATNVVVTDKVDDEYTMIFGIPQSQYADHSQAVADALSGQEFYIEFLEYALDANHERTTSTSKLKLYLGVTGNTYYAATAYNSTNGANKFADPVFTAKANSSAKGYWSQVSSAAAGAGELVITVGGTNWKFMEDGSGTHNVTAGAYAYGTIDSVTNMSTDLVIVTPYFAYCAKTRMLAWTVERLTTVEYALNYFLYLDNSAADIGEDTETKEGPYPTNDYAYITYTNFNGSDCRQEFPIPRLTWNGAQVSYVFYLVNENGDPINKSGQVVDFANATFVTDVYTKHIIWNDDSTPETDSSAAVEGIAYLDANWEALNLLPEGYDLYDTAAKYELMVYEDHEGNVLNNFFTISGSPEGTEIVCDPYTHTLMSDDTTKVYNTKAGTKYSAYGTYTKENAADIDFTNTTVAFAVVWHATLIPDVVVVDYGLDVLIDVVRNDMLANIVTGISDNNNGYGAAMNDGINTAGSKFGTADLTIAGNTISIENENQIRFHQGDMEFKNYVKFYYESPVSYYEGGNSRSGHLYSSVTVIPATTIYYEDNFVTYESFTWNGGWQAVDKTSDKWVWSQDGTTSTATQAQDRPGASLISGSIDADNIYGYDGAYADMSTHSNGSAMKATVDYDNKGTASFTFWGTGFDVISLTSNATGSIYLEVYDQNNNLVVDRMVDTYYGYKQVAGDADHDGEIEEGEMIWVVDPAANDSIYQVPVIQANDLTYGKYTAKIIASYNEHYDHVDPSNANGSYDFYLDAIRIYDPANDGASDGTVDTTIENAYVADHEGWPSYIELRDKLIGSKSFADMASQEGMVFIDGDPEVGDAQLADYIAYGPNNEVYLAAGQSVAFQVDAPAILDRIHIGIKSADGSDVSYTIKNVAGNGSVTNQKTFTLNTSTDMYYDMTEWKDGIVVITNSGNSGILSITNIKSTYTEKPAGNGDAQANGAKETRIYMTAKAADVVLNAMKPEPVNPFADVQKEQFFYDAVLWAVENGITNGVNADHFGPYINCNRAQVVTFLWRAAGSPAPANRVNPFTDVPDNVWYTDAVLWAVENGITNGLTATTFGPDALCNRAQVVTFLWRANGSKVVDGAANPFVDVPADAFYHDAVVWAVKNGITTGASAAEFNPNGICMRAHVVTFLYRAEQLREHEVSGWTCES